MTKMTWAAFSGRVRGLFHCFYPALSNQGEGRTMCGRGAKPGIVPSEFNSRINKGHVMPVASVTCWHCYVSYCKQQAQGEYV